jgi:Tol biopolymer transport system component
MIRFLRLTFLFLILLTASVALALAVAPSGGPPPLVHQTGTTFNTELALLDPLSGVSINLTLHPQRDTSPAWLPTGASLSFSSNRNGLDMDLYRLDVRTREVTLVQDTVQEGSGMVWSPSGERAAYLEGTGTFVDVFVMEADGTHRSITRNGIVPSMPAWSPDGERLAFINAHQNMPDVYVSNLDGGTPRRITRGAMASSPVWLPDGQHILYSVRADEGRTVMVVDLETGDQQEVLVEYNTWFMAGSPDGDTLAVIVWEDEARNLYLTSLSGDSMPRRLTMGLLVESMDWSPDGEWLVFGARQPEVLWTLFTDDPRRLADLRQGLRPALRKWLWGEPTLDTTQPELYIYHIDWDAPRRVTFNGEGDTFPTWQPTP